MIFALARTAKYERILNVLALVAQNKQPCRSERLALTHRYTNKHTRQREAGRIRGESRWTERASVSPHPHVSYVVPSVPSRHGPPTPGTRTRTHSGIHAHAFHISHPMSPGYDTNKLPTPIVFTCDDQDRGCRTFVRLSRVCADGLLWLLETFREDITSALHFQLSAYLTLRWSSPCQSALLNMLFDTGTHSANVRSTT